ncbi:MAG: pseudouridine synthase [Chloroflexi bacterium OLB15]|nr:MAG: pseudouridine synthase [Chloroflexi bacterium OLB15]
MRLIRFWKPYGVLTKFTDSEGRPTLADYIDAPGLYAAGRLDLDSEGLLLLTDSGAFNARLTQPKYRHLRTYWVQVERIPDETALDKLRQGVLLKDGMTLPALARMLDAPPQIDGKPLPERSVPIRFRKNVPTAWIELSLIEGRNRQVRRMTAAVGFPTLRLVRWSIGEGASLISLSGLQPGEWQPVEDKITRLIRGRFQRR